VLLLAGRVCTCAPRETAPRGRAPRGSREREESAGRHADVTGEGGGSQRKKASPRRGDEYRPRARARACVYDAMGSRKDKSKPIGSAFPSSSSPLAPRESGFSRYLSTPLRAVRPARSFFDCPTRINDTCEMSFLNASLLHGEDRLRAREKEMRILTEKKDNGRDACANSKTYHPKVLYQVILLVETRFFSRFFLAETDFNCILMCRKFERCI